MREHIRTCVFRPYRRGMGPTFTLRLYDMGEPYQGGPHWRIGYTLDMSQNGRSVRLFDASDFGCAPSNAIDSDACVESLMGFLTLRPGDTDSDYFKSYSDEQRAYCDQHAEQLGACVMFRFCDEDGNVKARK